MYLNINFFNREEFVKEKTEINDRKDTICSDEEYGPGEALAVEEFTEMKDKINVIDNKFGIYFTVLSIEHRLTILFVFCS